MKDDQALRRAAQAVVDRWDTPLWKDVPATATFIYELRDALAAQPPKEFAAHHEDAPHKSTEDERNAFEAWLQDVHMLDSKWNAARNCFDDFPAHLAFKAWQAARAKSAADARDAERWRAARTRFVGYDFEEQMLLFSFVGDALTLNDKGADAWADAAIQATKPQGD